MTATSQELPSLAQLIDLTGRTAVVTGGTKGIGLGIARRLHEAGAAVVVADLDAEGADQAAGMLGADRAAAVAGDLADAAVARTIVGTAVDRFGGIDVLVNNAGVYPNVPFVEMDVEVFRRVLDVNLLGVFHCTKAAVARMLDQGRGGRIVNITSIDALHPSMVGLAHYDASKHGLWGFTKNIALELAPRGIWVNAVAPGGVLTPGVGAGTVAQEALDQFTALIPMGRWGDPDDIARATLFLASDLASYITGTQLVVDGGRLLG